MQVQGGVNVSHSCHQYRTEDYLSVLYQYMLHKNSYKQIPKNVNKNSQKQLSW